MMEQERIQVLVDKSRQEDTAAFALLVSEFQPLVFRLAFRLLCNEDEARYGAGDVCEGVAVIGTI